MKEQKLYVCEFCNTSYKDKEMAKKCEKNHKEIVSVIPKKYLPLKSDNSGYPYEVTVTMSDGKEIKYTRGQ